MSKWIEYTGSDEQIQELANARTGFIVRWADGKLSYPYSMQYTVQEIEEAWGKFTHYLICQPHPYADLIKIWADTGCPVYIKPKTPGILCGSVVHGSRVDWNHDDFEFSLTPFEDQ